MAWASILQEHFPLTPGSDFSGVVTAIGDGVNTFAPGDEMYGFIKC